MFHDFKYRGIAIYHYPTKIVPSVNNLFYSITFLLSYLIGYLRKLMYFEKTSCQNIPPEVIPRNEILNILYIYFAQD